MTVCYFQVFITFFGVLEEFFRSKKYDAEFAGDISNKSGYRKLNSNHLKQTLQEGLF